MIEHLTQNPWFGLVATLFLFLLGHYLFDRTKFILFNPLLFSVTGLIILLVIFNIPYDTYQDGAKYISFWVAPATVALAIKLERNYQYLRANYLAIIVGIIVGVVFHSLFIFSVAWVYKFHPDMIVSLLPKSVTTAIAVGISESSGGIGPMTVALVALTGIIGSIIGPTILKVLKITEPVAQGTALGAGAHAMGTSRAIEMGEVQGAMGGLAIIVTGIVMVLMMPIANAIIALVF